MVLLKTEDMCCLAFNPPSSAHFLAAILCLDHLRFVLYSTQVKVVLLKTEDMCSVAFNEKHTQEVTLKGSSSLVVPYTIIPLKAGEMLLEVLAMAKGFMGSDGVKKKLRVGDYFRC